MTTASGIFDDIEQRAMQTSLGHSWNSCAKVVVAVTFLVTLVSFPRHEVSAILPLALVPISWAALSSIPLGWVVARILLPLVFLAIFGAANLFYDQTPQGMLFGVVLRGGLLSWFSIIIKAALSLAIVLLLVSTTGIVRLSAALARLHLPHLMISTLLLLYRYIFVLSDEAARMNRARNSRSFGRRGVEISTAAILLGQLLLRSLDRAEKIHAAMVARGFNEHRLITASESWRIGDWMTTGVCLLFLAVSRFCDPTHQIGKLLLEVFA